MRSLDVFGPGPARDREASDPVARTNRAAAASPASRRDAPIGVWGADDTIEDPPPFPHGAFGEECASKVYRRGPLLGVFEASTGAAASSQSLTPLPADGADHAGTQPPGLSGLAKTTRARARLRIEGVPTPIIACVVAENEHGLTVRQPLPFLERGRHVLIDGHRCAEIAAVQVIDGDHGPDLVVELRYVDQDAADAAGPNAAGPDAAAARKGPATLRFGTPAGRRGRRLRDPTVPYGRKSDGDGDPWPEAREPLDASGLAGPARSAREGPSPAGRDPGEGGRISMAGRVRGDAPTRRERLRRAPGTTAGRRPRSDLPVLFAVEVTPARPGLLGDATALLRWLGTLPRWPIDMLRRPR